MNRSLSIFFCPRHLLFKYFYPQTLCVPSPFLSSPSPADSIVGFLMSSLGSREKGRASQKAGGDGEGQRERGGNRRPTDQEADRRLSAAVVDDHIAAYIHYPNTFSIVVGITPLALLASSLKPAPSSKFSRVVTDPKKKIGSPIRSSIMIGDRVFQA